MDGTWHSSLAPHKVNKHSLDPPRHQQRQQDYSLSLHTVYCSFMSRIPLPAQGLHHYNTTPSNNNTDHPANAVHSPRPSSPLVNRPSFNMSASPATDTRKKQSKRDEVS